MNILVHTAIAATSLAATVAVAFAGAAILDSGAPVAAAKSDRLEVAAEAPAETRYITIESRGDQVSVLQRVPVTLTASN
ncbi:MAG: hypothetical protein KDJ86_06525 [Bauldia sp.]|uniref:hypothetical protein n=1 Tax=Bauldia sp. TaxID=2575872 RepID=UPI001E10331A|nr:hypothetical protein [Bauldia sp.]MCB1495421.1 hypothetical protein [Bauldia sp.]